MKAAVVNSFGTPPSFQQFRDPVAGNGETVVTVHAAPLTPIVRKLAAGTHYTSAATAGFVPGVDGVGVDSTGERVYFLFPRAPFGSMAERALIGQGMTAPVPDDLPDDRAAAIASAGLASWVALTRRAALRPGETVLVLGATGASGGLAVQTARHLGAGRVIAVGRNRERLDRLDADVRISLDALPATVADGVDVVLDFVWGEPAARVIEAATTRRMRYVQIGNDAGATIPLRADALRSTGLELLGSGIGSVPLPELVNGARELLAVAVPAGFHTPFTTVPLESVTSSWNADPAVRHIFHIQGDQVAPG